MVTRKKQQLLWSKIMVAGCLGVLVGIRDVCKWGSTKMLLCLESGRVLYCQLKLQPELQAAINV